MATPGSVYGLIPSQNKGKFSLQTLGQVEDDTDVENGGLPKTPFSTLVPPTSGQGAQQIAQIQAANIPQGFQFTGAYDAENRMLGQQESDSGLRRTNSLASIAEKYLTANQEAESSSTKGRKKLFEALADKGALGSSAALDSVSEYDTEFNRYLDKLAKSRAYDQSLAEGGYANELNMIGRQREGLVGRQQAEEEARRVEEARVRAEAERQAREEEGRRAQIQQLIAAQEQARVQAEQAAQQAAAARVAYQPVQAASYGGGGGGSYDYGGGGGGGYQEEAPQAAAPPGNIVMPAFNNRVTTQAVEGWIRQNVDPNISGVAMAKVREVLAKAGPTGVSQADLGWLIRQYPNSPVPTQTAPRGTAAPTRRV